MVLSGKGKGFTSGLDLAEFSSTLNFQDEEDIGRKAFAIRNIVGQFQNSINSVEIVIKHFSLYF